MWISNKPNVEQAFLHFCTQKSSHRCGPSDDRLNCANSRAPYPHSRQTNRFLIEGWWSLHQRWTLSNSLQIFWSLHQKLSLLKEVAFSVADFPQCEFSCGPLDCPSQQTVSYILDSCTASLQNALLNASLGVATGWRPCCTRDSWGVSHRCELAYGLAKSCSRQTTLSNLCN